MFTRKVRNVLFVLFMTVSIVLVPTVSAEVVIESDRSVADVVIEPNGLTPEVVGGSGLNVADVVIEPNGMFPGS